MRGTTRSPAMVIILSLLTCGIYMLYWLYVVSTEISNQLPDQASNPSMDLLLSIFCGPYLIYVLYKQSKGITEIQRRMGLPSEDNAIIILLLSIFGLGVVSIAIMQDSLNKVWDNM